MHPSPGRIIHELVRGHCIQKLMAWVAWNRWMTNVRFKRLFRRLPSKPLPQAPLRSNLPPFRNLIDLHASSVVEPRKGIRMSSYRDSVLLDERGGESGPARPLSVFSMLQQTDRNSSVKSANGPKGTPPMDTDAIRQREFGKASQLLIGEVCLNYRRFANQWHS